MDPETSLVRAQFNSEFVTVYLAVLHTGGPELCLHQIFVRAVETFIGVVIELLGSDIALHKLLCGILIDADTDLEEEFPPELLYQIKGLEISYPPLAVDLYQGDLF